MRPLAALLLALWVNACALGMSPVLPPNVQQRTAQDCLIAALATLGRWPYETVEATRLKLQIPFANGGLSGNDALLISAALGLPLKIDRDPNPALHDGIIVTLPEAGVGHAVYVERGYILDPAGSYPTPWIMWLKELEPEMRLGYMLVVDKH